MKPVVKKVCFIVSLSLLLLLLCGEYTIQAQQEQGNNTSQEAQIPTNETSRIEPPELPPTPRSKLEIIQYILLPFAIGASVWLIIRMEKLEQEEANGDKRE